MRPGLLTGPSVIAVLGRDVVVRLLEISRSGCLLESSHAMPAGTIAALAIEIDGREYRDEVRVSRSQLLVGVGERYESPGSSSVKGSISGLADSGLADARRGGCWARELRRHRPRRTTLDR